MDENTQPLTSFNSTDYRSGETTGMPKTIRVFFVITVSLAVTLTNLLNLTVLRKTQQIPQIAKICLLNLSVADLTSGLLCMVPCMVPAFIEIWPYGTVWCQIAGIFHGTCCAVSIWSLAVVSVDRYVAIRKPLRYHTLLTSRRCVLVLCGLWVFGFATFLLPILISEDHIYYQYDPVTVICGMYWEFPWLCIVTGVYIPVVSGFIIVYTSLGILKDSTQSRRKRIAPSESGQSGQPIDTRAVKILGATAVVYFTTWGPYVVAVMTASFAADVIIPPELRFVFTWLANSNSFMNVFIYSMVYKSFRLRAKHLVIGVLCCESSSLESTVVASEGTNS